MPQATPTQASQDQINLDREANAHALDVIDDIANSQTEGRETFQPRQQPSGEDTVTQRQAPRPRVDSKRNEIIARFKGIRGTRPQDQPDDIDSLTRSGVPPEFEQYREQDEPEDAAAERSRAIADGHDDDGPEDRSPPEAAPAKQKVRLRVNHQDLELDMEDVIAHAQQSLAADGILNKAKSKLDQIDQLYNQTRDRVARPDPSGHQTGQERSQTDDDASRGQENNGESHTSDDDGFSQLIETMQFGDGKDAVPLLRNTIDQAVDRRVTATIQQQRMNDEAARTGAVLQEFNGKHPELLKDRFAQAVMKQHVFESQVEDLGEIGVTMDSLAASIGHAPTPGDIAQAHQFYRSQGYNLRKPENMLTVAHDHMLDWRGAPKKGDVPTPNTGDTDTRRVAPRIAVNVDRGERRQNIAPAPNRTAPPQQQRREVAPQRRAPSSVVQRIQEQRNLARGRAIGA